MITKFFNHFLRQVIIPDSWKEYKVCLIPKSSKGYRLVSNCLMKIYERILNNRLTWWIEHYKLLPNEFNSFKQGRSCIDNITQLILEANLAMIEGRHMGALFLDISEASDNVYILILIDELREMNTPAVFIRAIEILLVEIILHFEVNRENTSLQHLHEINQKTYPQMGKHPVVCIRLRNLPPTTRPKTYHKNSAGITRKTILG